MSNKYLDSAYEDNTAVNLIDVVGSNTLKIYPYELINAKNSVGFIAPQTVTVASISQANFDNKQGMLQDKNGNWYFECMPTTTLLSKLDTSTTTSTISKILKEEVQFQLYSNTYYENGMEKIAAGNTYFSPAIFTVGAPIQINFVNEPHYTPTWYENKSGIFEVVKDDATLNSLGKGEDGDMKNKTFKDTDNETEAIYFFFNEGGQEVYIATNVTASKEYDYGEVLDKNGEYVINFANVAILTAQFDNCIIKFTKDIYNKDVVNQKGDNGLTIQLDNKMLLHSLKVKGTETGLDDSSSDIDLITTTPMLPFKATPISVKDKVTMYMDWFDYDSVLPLAYIDMFRDNAPLSDAIKNAEDLKMINDMILASYLFASEFQDIPVLPDTKQGAAGKLDPEYKIGSQSINVSKLTGKDPIKVIDGIYEKHIRQHPSFLREHKRYQPAQGIINSLCRYIYSSHTIGKGNNAFGWAYLPWYLQPTDGIKVVKDDKKKTIILKPDLKYTSYSIYFSENYSNQDINRAEINSIKKLVLPKKCNLSNEVLLQTDRKLTLPDVPYSIQAMTKLPLPGDINTRTSTDLKYMWWLPISKKASFEKLMLNSLTSHSVTPQNKEFQGHLNNTPYGIVWGSNELNAAILKAYPPEQYTLHSGLPKILTEYTSIQSVIIKGNTYPDTINLPYMGEMSATQIFNKYRATSGQAKYRVTPKVGDVWEFNGKKMIFTEVNGFFVNLDIDDDSILFGDYSTTSFKFKIPFNSFGPFTMMTKHTIPHTEFGFNERKLLFDKFEWERFLTAFGFINTESYTIDLKTENDVKLKRLDELIISSIFGDNITLLFNNVHIKIPLFNKNDETISTQKILFS